MTSTIPGIIARLLARRKRLQDAYDDLISQPASYSITGSVSATNHQLTELRTEMAALDRRISRLMGSRQPYGMTLQLPDYHQGLEGF